MKIFFNWHSVIILITVTAVFASCNTSSDDIPTDEQSGYADYTIIMYGCGGGNLDEYLELNLSGIEDYGYCENVQFTALMKCSESYQDKYPGTRQFTLGETGLTHEYYSDVNFELNNPANLAKFIQEAKESMPAKNYILLIWNHGAPISYYDVPYSDLAETKSVCYDDNSTVTYEGTTIYYPLSIFDIEGALEIAGGVDLIYMDVCSMNMIENIYQLRNQTNYVLATAHATPDVGGNYIELMDALDNNDDIVAAMKQYIPKAADFWRLTEGGDYGFDLTLTDVSYMEDIVEYIAEYAAELIELRDNLIEEGDEQAELEFYYYNGDSSENAKNYFDNPTINTYYYSEGGLLYTYPDSRYSIDLVDAFAGLTLFKTSLRSTVVNIKYLFDKAIVANETNVEAGATCDYFSMGIAWPSAEFYNTKHANGYSLSDIYPLLDFEQATKWSKFIEGNDMRPVGLNADSGEFYEL